MAEDRIRQIEDDLKDLSSKRKELLTELRGLRGTDTPTKIYGQPLDNYNSQTAEGRVDIFLKLFACRQDVYLRYWENQKNGKKGFSPVCSNEWIKGLCNKPKIKCSECDVQAFLALDGFAAKNHLQGREIIGTYAIRKNNSCIFLTADFDKSTWKEDVVAFKDAGLSIGVEIALERSRSGNGGHAWIFFVGEVSAYFARHLPRTNFLEKEVDDFELAGAEAVMDVVVKKTREDSFDGIIDIELKNQLYIDTHNLPSKIITSLKRSATFANPEFFKLQRMRFSTWKTPRYIFCGDLLGDRLVLPRGNMDFCTELAEEIGAELIIHDQRPIFKRKRIKFIGKLRTDQKKAVNEICKHDCGVLVAPPGVGKTVMGCYVIGKRKVSTLILVHRRPLMEQWIERIGEFLDIDVKEVGSYGGSKKKPKGKIDVAMLQTLSKLEDSTEFLSQYGQIIIDECHHIPATSFEDVLKKISAKYFLGLTATPVRKDGLQAILYMQCGPIRYEMEEFGAKDLIKKVYIKETAFQLMHNFSEQVPIHEIWSHLIKSPERLEMIAKDVKSCIDDGAFPLIVSDRKEHLALLSKSIFSFVGNIAEAIILVGDMGKKERKAAFEKINSCIKEKKPFYILATGSLIGEGIDIPILDRLILAMPISFKGRLKQYVGRIHRPFEGKKEVHIYDYLDPNMGLTISMFKKRLKAFKDMDYKIESSVGSKVNQLVDQRDLFSEFKNEKINY